MIDTPHHQAELANRTARNLTIRHYLAYQRQGDVEGFHDGAKQ